MRLSEEKGHDMNRPYELEVQDRMARKLIMPCLVVGAKTPRTAYEMVRKQPVSNEEWDRHRAPWERNWPECVELYDSIVSMEETMRKAYDEYRSSAG